MKLLKTRFAPSPTGLVHLGNARTALFSALLGEVFLLRIEDTDAERSRQEFVDDLIKDLSWLGLDWQEGPRSSDPTEDWFQSRRGAVYNAYYDELERSGLAYPCFCSPQELEISRKVQLSSGRPPRYSGKCAHLTADEIDARRQEGVLATLRFRVPKNLSIEFEDLVRGPQHFNTDDIGDFIIRRADGSSAFFFCNAIDDALMGVTHVLRGEDHLSNTPRQLLILQALELPLPAYAHSALIFGDDGTPLSKRNGSRSILQLREEGYFPLAVVNLLARLGHHYENDALMSFEELKAGFDLSHLGRSPARFDQSHLDHWQSLAVRNAENAELQSWLRAETLAVVPAEDMPVFLEIVRSNCVFPSHADEWAKILFTDELSLEPEMEKWAKEAGEAFFMAVLDAAKNAGGNFEEFMKQVKTGTGAKGKQLFMPLRAALTGRHDGPELGVVYRVLDAHRLHRRLAEFTWESV